MFKYSVAFYSAAALGAMSHIAHLSSGIEIRPIAPAFSLHIVSDKPFAYGDKAA